MAEPVPGRRHQHFKGEDKRYYVVCTAFATEGEHEELVIYIPLYGENAGIPLARPKRMWEEYVSRELGDGKVYKGDRFWPLPAAKPNLG